MKATDVIQGLGQGVTLFPGLARIFGRNESLLMVQLLYWTSDEKPWTYKKAEEIEHTTTLTWREQKTARKRLAALGVLKEDRQFDKHRIGYRVNRKRVNRMFLESNRVQSNCAKRDDQLRQTRLVIAPNAMTHEREKRQNKEEERKNKKSGFFASDSFEKKAAKKLQAIVLAEYKINKDIRAWPKTFAQMQRFDQITKQRIKRVLVWYAEHIGEMWVPKVEDAQGFRRKFGAIESKMKEAEPTEKKFELRAELKDLARELRQFYPWPQVAKDELPEALQLTVDAYAKWREKRRAIMRELDEEHRMKAIDRNLFHTLVQPPDGFARRWFRAIAKKYANWSEWSGHLKALAFTPEQPLFRAMGIEVVGEKTWTDYIAFLNES